MTQFDDLDIYDMYETEFDPMHTDRQARRQRKPRKVPPTRHTPQTSATDFVEEAVGLEAGFATTYQPSRHESGWLMQSLREFYDQELISDVNGLVKGGKEASVYRCKAHPQTGMEWIAAKVYRPRMFRQLRNDKMYRQGRTVLKQSGKAVKATDTRAMRAMGKKSSFGEQLAHTSWLMHEYTTLERFYEKGMAVPKPVATTSNAILMGYVGDENMAAPTLSQVSLDKGEANRLFQVVVENIELMLQDGRIHGDLSAYNILYWQGAITFIDFPQVTNAHVSRETHMFGSQVNPDAEFILERDITRVCEYFQKQGVHCNPRRIMDNLWYTYIAKSPEDMLAEASKYELDNI